MKSPDQSDKQPTRGEALTILQAAREAGHLPERFIEEQLATMRRKIRDDTHARVERVAQVQEKRELEPAQIERFVGELRANFMSNGKELPKLHPSIQWAKVEASLRAQPKMMWSLSKMEETGGKVDVIGEDDKSFLFGDTSIESPDGRRNAVFDAKAEAYLEQKFPNKQFNGNAEERVKAWGVDFMNEEQYRALQKLGEFDAQTWSWLKTPPNVRAAGYALNGYCYGERVVYVHRSYARSHDGRGGFRCVLRIPKVKA